MKIILLSRLILIIIIMKALKFAALVIASFIGLSQGAASNIYDD
jgi:hypothetical protein